MRILGLGNNGLDFGFREVPTAGNVFVVYGDLFLEIEEMIERWG